MIRYIRAPTLLIVAVLATGCAGPLTQREAVQIATGRLTKYCGASPGCKPMRLTHAQQSNDRWLIEFDTPANQFGIIVSSDGNSEITIWDKARDATRQ